MAEHNHIKLTSSELAVFSGSYLNDSLAVCMMSYFLEHVEDPEVKESLEYAIGLSRFHLELDEKVFGEERIPLPHGFTEEDVNVKAPRLYPDEAILHYLLNLGIIGMNAYSSGLAVSARKDVRDHFTSCLASSAELYNRTATLMQEKGLFIRAPYIPYPSENEMVEKKHFLAGWVGEQRALTGMEISNLFMNLYRNAFGKCLLTGFAQTSGSEVVRQYMKDGISISRHTVESLSSFLTDSHLPDPVPSVFVPSASTAPVFSDKLMMFHTVSLIGSGMGYYGMALGMSPRRDLAAAYSRLLVEAGRYADKGVKIMIENGWMEKPPSAPDRDKLIKD